MIRTEIYSKDKKEEWDAFVTNSKNGTFLFYRDFMEYHSDRFKDYSFLFYKEDKLIAFLPGNLNGTIFYSHQGLTYGGLVMGQDTKAIDVLEVFNCFVTTLSRQGIKEIIYKAIPHIYHKCPAEEDLYALFLQKAKLKARNISSTILLNNPGKYSKSRQRGLDKSESVGLIVKESNDLDIFWNILTDSLMYRYNVSPVHSLAEIRLLKDRFPDNIKFYGAYTADDELVAGEVIFETATVIHAQYTAATTFGRENGAVDLLIDFIIKNAGEDKRYFDYGISTENDGLYLNEGLIYQKEGFGARAIVYDIYSIQLD